MTHLRSLQHRPLLLLSAVIHLCLAAAFGPGGGLDTATRRPSVLTVQLVPAGTSESDANPPRPESSVPVQASHEDQADQAVQTPAPAESSPAAEAAVQHEPLVPLLTPVEPRYYRSQELTDRPRVQQDIEPWLRLTIEGVRTQAIVLRLLINEFGEIDKVEIDQSDLPPAAEAAVADAFSKIRFLPGKLDAVAVKSQMKIEVTLEAPPTVPVITIEKK